MVILETTTDEPTSDEATSDSSASDDPSTDETDSGDDGLVSRLESAAERAATLLEPFATLLTALVQAATVYTLVRQD
jgi:hypothetical protein